MKVLRVILFGWFFAACGCGGGGGSGPAPALRFQLTQVTPPDQAEDVPLSQELDLIFSKAVDSSSLTQETVQVVAESGDVIPGDRSVPFLSPGIVRFLPRSPYLPFAVHTIRVTTGVLDVDGAPLDQDYVFQFQTQEKGPVFPTQQQVIDKGDLLVRGRWFHRMTRMATGTFLVAGGYGADNGALADAEHLVPSLGQSFLLASRLAQPRAGHVQILLKDGRVLLAGGEAGDQPFLPLSSCEIFNPATFAFSRAASMTAARSFAEAALLPDGRVLVVGGQSLGAPGTQFRDDAEIYDPVADAWTPVASTMAARRTGHFVAAVDPLGILVVGGTSGVPSAERFDPLSGLFRSDVGAPRFDHYFAAATLLDDGRPVLVGGLGNRGITIHDPGFGFLAGTNTMLAERTFATATALSGGRALIVGGTDYSSTPPILSDTLDLFYPVGHTGKVLRVPGVFLPRPTSHHAAAVDLNGVVWITGGLPDNLFFPGLRQAVVILPE